MTNIEIEIKAAEEIVLTEDGMKRQHALREVLLREVLLREVLLREVLQEADMTPALGVTQAADMILVDGTKVAGGATLDATKEEEEMRIQGVSMEEVATQGVLMVPGGVMEDDTTVARAEKEIDIVQTTAVEDRASMTAAVVQGVTMEVEVQGVTMVDIWEEGAKETGIVLVVAGAVTMEYAVILGETIGIARVMMEVVLVVEIDLEVEEEGVDLGVVEVEEKGWIFQASKR